MLLTKTKTVKATGEIPDEDGDSKCHCEREAGKREETECSNAPLFWVHGNLFVFYIAWFMIWLFIIIILILHSKYCVALQTHVCGGKGYAWGELYKDSMLQKVSQTLTLMWSPSEIKEQDAEYFPSRSANVHLAQHSSNNLKWSARH